MGKGIIYISDYPDMPPEWYWVSGLHDALITSVEEKDIPFDYEKFSKSDNKSNFDRNVFTIKVDAKDAVYDTAVKEIRFYNYKLLSKGITAKDRRVFWKADRLTEEKNHYILEIDLEDFDSYPVCFTFKIKFDRAEVDR